MKKTLLTLLAVGIIPNTLAAHNINTGTIEVTGGANLSFISGERNKDTDVKSTNLSLDSLYYVAPNLGVGLHWEYTSSEIGKKNSSETTIGPAVAFNIPIAPKMSVKPLAYFGLVKGEDDTNDDFDGTAWGLGANLNYFIRENISIGAGIVYESKDVDFDSGGDYKYTGFTTAVGLSVYF